MSLWGPDTAETQAPVPETPIYYNIVVDNTPFLVVGGVMPNMTATGAVSIIGDLHSLPLPVIRFCPGTAIAIEIRHALQEVMLCGLSRSAGYYALTSM